MQADFIWSFSSDGLLMAASRGVLKTCEIDGEFIGERVSWSVIMICLMATKYFQVQVKKRSLQYFPWVLVIHFNLRPSFLQVNSPIISLWLIFYHLCSSFGNTDFIHSRSVICIPPTFYFTFSYFYFYFLFRFLSPPCEFWEIFQNYLLYVVIFLFFSL